MGPACPLALYYKRVLVRSMCLIVSSDTDWRCSFVSTEKFHMTLVKTAASEQESVLDHWICVDKAGHPQCPHIQSHNLGPSLLPSVRSLAFPSWSFSAAWSIEREEGKEEGECLKQSSHTKTLMVPPRHTEDGWHFWLPLSPCKSSENRRKVRMTQVTAATVRCEQLWWWFSERKRKAVPLLFKQNIRNLAY